MYDCRPAQFGTEPDSGRRFLSASRATQIGYCPAAEAARLLLGYQPQHRVASRALLAVRVSAPRRIQSKAQDTLAQADSWTTCRANPSCLIRKVIVEQGARHTTESTPLLTSTLPELCGILHSYITFLPATEVTFQISSSSDVHGYRTCISVPRAVILEHTLSQRKPTLQTSPHQEVARCSEQPTIVSRQHCNGSGTPVNCHRQTLGVLHHLQDSLQIS